MLRQQTWQEIIHFSADKRQLFLPEGSYHVILMRRISDVGLRVARATKNELDLAARPYR
jgi:hypothetical protein